MPDPEQLITHKLGPLPVGVWGILLAGGIVVLAKVKGGAGASAATRGTLASSTDTTGTTSGAGGSGGPVTVLNPGQSVYDPGSGAVATGQPGFTAQELGTLFGGLSDSVTQVQYSGGGTQFGLNKNDEAQLARDAQTAKDLANIEGNYALQTTAQQGAWGAQFIAQQGYWATQQAMAAQQAVNPQHAANA